MLRLVKLIIPVFVILLYLAYNLYFSVNFPFQDDFLLIQFIEVVSQGGLGVLGMLEELFRTFNDHKAVIPRLIALIEYNITGVLNFRFYIILVLINITYIFYFLYLQFKKTSLSLYYFLPAFFLYFHPLYHDISGWALNGMQHSFLTAFTVSAIMLASRRTNLGLAGAILCCFLATFTHGNGILSFPAIVFYFLVVQDYRKTIITIVAMFAALFIYLIGYESGQAMRLPESIAVFASCLFGFVGSMMAIFPQPVLWSSLFGFCLVGFLFYYLFRIAKNYFATPLKLTDGTLELLSLFVFIFITGLVIALFRSWAGPDSTLTSRFQIYACLSVVIVYILLVGSFPFFRKKAVLLGVMSLSVFYWAYSYYAASSVVGNKRTAYLADVYNWEHSRTLFTVPQQLLKNASFYMNPGYTKGFFDPPEAIFSKRELAGLFHTGSKAKDDYNIFVYVVEVDTTVDRSNDYDRHFYIFSDVLPKRKGFLTDRFLVLRNQKTGVIYLKSATPKVEARKVIASTGDYYKPGFNAFFRPDDLASGNYQLGIVDVTSNGAKTFYKLDRSLNVKNAYYSLQSF